MKQMTISRFTVFYILYCTFVGGLAFGLSLLFPHANLLAPKFWVLFGFLAGITFIGYTTAALGMQFSPKTGSKSVMWSVVIKMFFCIAFVLAYSVKGVEKPVTFVLNFFSLYLLFTIFEISSLLLNLRHQNK